MSKPPGERISDRFRVTRGEDFRWGDFEPDSSAEPGDKEAGRVALEDSLARLSVLQDKLYAQDRWSLLVVLQALDAAGKDGTIKHVFSGVNPQGCSVVSFKAPSAEELDHDWMWRCFTKLPERGHIGIFNRSYYEEVLVVRVHKEILAAQKIPPELVKKHVFDERLADVGAFESYLARNGTKIVKVYLNVSLAEQKRRFLERMDDPEKHWKFSARDVEERKHWEEYRAAYEAAIRSTAADHAPWYVVPADKKWFTRLVVSDAVVRALEELDLAYPKLASEERARLDRARQDLATESD